MIALFPQVLRGHQQHRGEARGARGRPGELRGELRARGGGQDQRVRARGIWLSKLAVSVYFSVLRVFS